MASGKFRMAVTTMEGYKIADDAIDAKQEDQEKRALDEESRKLQSDATEYLKTGNYPKAAELFEKIVHHQIQMNGEQDATVGTALHNVASVYIKMKHYDKAISFCLEAVRVRKIGMGEDHVDVASSLMKLGTVYCATEKREFALMAFREALSIRQNKLGMRDPGVGQVLGHIGVLHFEEGENLAALVSLQDALAIARLSEDGNHEKGEILCNIGTVRLKRKQYEQAIVALDESRRIQQLEYDDAHPIFMGTLNCLAYAHSKNGNNKEALRIYKKILRSQIAQHGAFHVDCSRTLSKMSIIYEKMENYSNAKDCTTEVLAIQSKELRPNNPEYLESRKTLARIDHYLKKATK